MAIFELWPCEWAWVSKLPWIDQIAEFAWTLQWYQNWWKFLKLIRLDVSPFCFTSAILSLLFPFHPFFSSFLSFLQDFLGQMFCTLGEIVGSPASRLEKPLGWVGVQVNSCNGKKAPNSKCDWGTLDSAKREKGQKKWFWHKCNYLSQFHFRVWVSNDRLGAPCLRIWFRHLLRHEHNT